MTENQKLREAFSRIRARLMLDVIDSHTISLVIADCDQALAMPTAEQVDDINVAESFTSVTKTAPPLVERELFKRTMMDKFGWERNDFKTDGRDFYMDGNTVTAWIAWQARAALSAGDAVDGPLIDEGSKTALSPLSDKDAIALIEEHTNDDNVIHAHEAIELIRSVERAHGIDAAMRKGQL